MNWEDSGQVDQLIRIARLELGTPLETADCLICGDEETAALLADRLQDRVHRYTCCGCGESGALEDGRFDLIFLFGMLSSGELARLTVPGALVMDLAPDKSGEYHEYDPSAQYHRVRILRLAQRSV